MAGLQTLAVSSNGRSRGRARELRYAEYLEQTRGGMARRFESGCFDIVWMQPDLTTLIQVKSTSAGAFHSFGPAKRQEAREQAALAGAEAVLVWWPKGRNAAGAEWIASSEWP
jgi:hypothetical protein